MRSVLLSLILALTLPAWGAQLTRTSSFEYDPDTGLLVKETIEPDQPQMRLDTAYTYDAFGNRTSVTVSSPATGTAAIATRATTTTWDADGQFPLTVANALGHTETKTFDPRFGVVTSLTGPNNLTTTWQYDGFGRKTQENRADGTQTVWTYDMCDAACPTNGVYRIVTQIFGAGTQIAPVSVDYFDSLNRKLHTATQGFDGSWIYKDTVYDNQGRVQKVSRPYFAGQAVYWVTSEYDDLGRVVRVYEPDDPATPALRVVYNGLTIARTNRKGQITTEVKNSQGQKVSVTDAMGNLTTYAYDPFGNLARTTDPAGNSIVNLYDLRGRKIQTTDPDLGTWTYEYNVLGELVKQTDAKNQVATMSYDVLGRMTRRVENGLISDWIYDAAAYGKGKLYQATTGAGYIRTHTYDTLGRPQSTLSNLGAGNPQLSSSVTYDAFGRASQQNYPNGLNTKTIYNAYGYVAEVRNAATNALYWQLNAVDAEGHATRETTGNGVVTDHGYAADTGRIQNIVANTAGGQQIQGQAYVYDTIGNVAIYADGPGNQLEIRGGYDAINRLTQIDSTIDGVASSQTLVYDALGNITSKTGVGNYAYGDVLHKHAVTAVTGGPANLGYAYDANGNLTSGAGRSVTWTAWNMPASLTQSGQTQSWLYTPEHDRYKMVASGRTTWYLNPSVHQGGHYERTLYTSGTVEHRVTLYGAGRAIGEVLTFEVSSGTAPAAQTRYFHSDTQGSITAVTDSAGVVLTRFRYDAWGKQTLTYGNNTGINATRQGHTAHEMLDGGLTHMNGRLYDPVLSRFVSADPTVDNPFDLQSLNRYSYVNNNPMGFTDPTGYFKLFGKKWSWWRDKVVKPVVAVVVAWNLGPMLSNMAWNVAATHAISVGTLNTMLYGGAALTGATAGYIASGGDMRAAGYGAVGGVLFFGAGEIGDAYGQAARVAAHAGAGCISASASGGNCGSGALGAGFSEWVGSNLPRQYDGFVMRVVLGGTAAELGGGKFANGATTAAFGYLFNHCAHVPGGCWSAFKDAAGMTRDWALGNGADSRVFGPGSIQVTDMMDAPGVNGARELLYSTNAQSVTNYRASFGLIDYLTTSSPTQQFVGSYRVDVFTVNAGADLMFVLNNNSSFKSLTYGAGPAYERSTLSPGGNMRQTYWWTEQRKQ
ncbi:RHS repeat-associated core domain-containing protein [uncultured Thiobacillus sp.]|uniref:RHS repeat domain-containing protein n=1 Tax=uncultured Thiobacillus sp. TaxID=189996 RepID=UPI00262AF939|nr:RHS repeat-associated core domain-containing protein [uncultured Thiobacillus sp.]